MELKCKFCSHRPNIVCGGKLEFHFPIENDYLMVKHGGSRITLWGCLSSGAIGKLDRVPVEVDWAKL